MRIWTRLALSLSRAMAVALWLALIVITGTMWARSYWRWDRIGRVHERRSVVEEYLANAVATSSPGAVEFSIMKRDLHFSPVGAVFRAWAADRDDVRWERRSMRLSSIATMPSAAAQQFAWSWESSGRSSWRSSSLFVRFPYWTAMAALLAPSLMLLPLWFHRRRRATRRAARCCEQCGYDLRASSDRCPECGAKIDERVDALRGTGP